RLVCVVRACTSRRARPHTVNELPRLLCSSAYSLLFHSIFTSPRPMEEGVILFPWSLVMISTHPLLKTPTHE
ncbi:hypothetical protein PFISCL1PPCAC_12693, partial [Pristionchus fissidentatus]